MADRTAPSAGDDGASCPHGAAIEHLHAHGRLRVWSILITVFGDLVQPRTLALPAPVLSIITDHLGIEPGAVRTALSRLAKETWIARERMGRSAAYRLTDRAAPEFEAATRRIYAPAPPPETGPASVVILPETAPKRPEDLGFLRLRRHIWLWPGPGTPPALPEALMLTGLPGTLPGWVLDILAPPQLADSYRRIVALFAPLEGATLPGPEAAAARVLLIHLWRRALLHLPPLPPSLLPADWPESSCRDFVRATHIRLSETAGPWLTECVPGMSPASRFVTKYD